MYSLRSLSVSLTTPLKHELSRTLAEIKKSFQIAKQQEKSVGIVEYAYSPRKRYRVTYLKSRFKHRYAIRHYVFEQYNYKINIYDPQDVDVTISSILGSLSPSVHANCTFSWGFNSQSSVSSYKTEENIIKRLISNVRSQ
ncbi:conserved hypothetical protein [Theileria equi strain WA]|uniref:Ribosomal protein S10 domain-containing protein n=1 Tax=Theileria equi strain WA TaxID=1537102 RepID=L1L966_THEEQ|nr:conserved hypothetical protein [Theileria equi strain WA]EKX72046.1 conserved hypothetical protein [Theileria equi strain WA]|eukprot:XP_004831498.1 conserved hypothetical protein [Theileria equi strain WA]